MIRQKNNIGAEETTTAKQKIIINNTQKNIHSGLDNMFSGMMYIMHGHIVLGTGTH